LDYPWCFFKASEEREREREREERVLQQNGGDGESGNRATKTEKASENPQNNTPLLFLHKMVSFQ
jgi:hypothetical protein